VKILNLLEMTQRYNNFEKESEAIVKNEFEEYRDDGKACGKIGNLIIKKHNVNSYIIKYGVWDEQHLIGFVRLDIDDNFDGMIVLNQLWFNSSYRGKGIFKQLFDFIFNDLKMPIVLGMFHSDDIYNLIKKNGFGRYKQTWYNPNTNESKPFDVNNIDKFYSHNDITGWQLVIH
jgi:hypothetical protein